MKVVFGRRNTSDDEEELEVGYHGEEEEMEGDDDNENDNDDGRNTRRAQHPCRSVCQSLG